MMSQIAHRLPKAKVEWWDSTRAYVRCPRVEAHALHFCHNPDDDNDSDPADEGDVLVTGKTALHLAACEKSPEMVQLLLERGADPNAQDAEGRTPLHEAALWGRLQSVKALLRFGADQKLECVRSGLRLRAVEFAKPSRENQIERHRRTPHEKTFERDRDREAIVCLLQNDTEQLNRSVSGFAFTSSSSPEGLRTLIAQFEVPKKKKAIGVLYRGSQLPCIAAMSGWGYQDLQQRNIQIAGKDWTNEVRRLCDTVGHRLAPKHPEDQGMPGQFNACHAEKHLIAFFVHRHLFLPDEVGKDTKSAESSLDAAFSSLDLKQTEENKRKLSALQEAEPLVSLKRATIMVCRKICFDCKKFVAKTNKTLGLNITLFHRCLDSECKVCPK